MIEKRKLPRKIADDVLEVSDQHTNSVLGQVVNISAEGLMMISNEPYATGSIYELDLKFPRLIKGHSKVSFGAEVVWSTPASQPGSHWSGFRIIDISEDGMLTIDDLILDWHIME
jgi:hypothetical protein